jgi:hypothetical protein
MEHDLAYSRYKDLENRHKADEKLLNVAIEVANDPNSTYVQKFNANLVKLIMKGKVKMGIGLGGTYGGSLNPSQLNDLVREAQRSSQSSSFQGDNVSSIIAPLILLAGAVGIPALISYFNQRNKDKDIK